MEIKALKTAPCLPTFEFPSYHCKALVTYNGYCVVNATNMEVNKMDRWLTGNILEKEHVSLKETDPWNFFLWPQQRSCIVSADNIEPCQHTHLASLSCVHRICTTSIAKAHHPSSKMERRPLVSITNVCFSTSALCVQWSPSSGRCTGIKERETTPQNN